MTTPKLYTTTKNSTFSTENSPPTTKNNIVCYPYRIIVYRFSCFRSLSITLEPLSVFLVGRSGLASVELVSSRDVRAVPRGTFFDLLARGLSGTVFLTGQIDHREIYGSVVRSDAAELFAAALGPDRSDRGPRSLDIWQKTVDICV